MSVKVQLKPSSTILNNHGLEPYGAVQRYVDTQVLRRCDPYVPFLTGYLKKSGILGTTVGSGKVIYTAVYARKNYYENAGRGIQGTAEGGLRGRYWFERMKIDHLDDILEGAKRIAGIK